MNHLERMTLDSLSNAVMLLEIKISRIADMLENDRRNQGLTSDLRNFSGLITPSEIYSDYINRMVSVYTSRDVSESDLGKALLFIECDPIHIDEIHTNGIIDSQFALALMEKSYVPNMPGFEQSVAVEKTGITFTLSNKKEYCGEEYKTYVKATSLKPELQAQFIETQFNARSYGKFMTLMRTLATSKEHARYSYSLDSKTNVSTRYTLHVENTGDVVIVKEIQNLNNLGNKVSYLLHRMGAEFKSTDDFMGSAIAFHKHIRNSRSGWGSDPDSLYSWEQSLKRVIDVLKKKENNDE